MNDRMKFIARLSLHSIFDNGRHILIQTALIAVLTSSPLQVWAEYEPPLPKDSAPWVGNTRSGTPCQGKAQGYGPYDYTNPIHRGDPLQTVEVAHFTPKVERLESGERSGKDPIGDIDYTLRAFPNHHRALYSLITYYFKFTNFHNERKIYPECYLQRALNFKRDDGNVLLLFGLYLHKSGALVDAQKKYKEAEKLMPNSAELHYNMGLLYFDLKDFANSKKYGIRAYELGYPLPGLRKKLKQAGHW